MTILLHKTTTFHLEICRKLELPLNKKKTLSAHFSLSYFQLVVSENKVNFITFFYNNMQEDQRFLLIVVER